MIKVSAISKTFRSGNHDVKAVHEVSFSLPSGKMAAIVGKSGSGKSTLLALLGALDSPDSGTIEVGGQEVTQIGRGALLGYRRSTVGFVFQNYQLIPNLTALENVMIPMELSGVSGHDRRHRAEQLLHRVGLKGEQLNRRPGKLSGGEQQRVAIARALANKPTLVLADEPTGNLDTQTSKLIIELLKSLANSEETTVIVVTHDQDIADQADVVYAIHDGHLVMA